jgi:hypothetical protein
MRQSSEGIVPRPSRTLVAAPIQGVERQSSCRETDGCFGIGCAYHPLCHGHSIAPMTCIRLQVICLSGSAYSYLDSAEFFYAAMASN